MQSGSFRSFLLRLFFVMLAALVVVYVDKTLLLAQTASNILLPIVVGAALAFVLSIPLGFLEKIWFPRSKKRWVTATRRPVCIILVLIFLCALLAALALLILPNFIDALAVLAKAVPEYAETVRVWIVENGDFFPELAQWAQQVQINWTLITDSVVQFMSSGSSDVLLSSTASLIGGVFGGVVDAVLSLIFMLYFLAGKEAIWRGLRRRMDAYLSREHVAWMIHAAQCANETFRSFILGQCTEALVLGGLCAVGMNLLRFPYATLVSVFIGVTALVPMVGAYVGAIFGALMILTIDPLSALWFLVFLIVLQQIEGNLIYPRVVGTSLRLPGVWVLVAVTVGGGLGGIGGILIGVPLTALIHRLVRENVDARLKAKGIAPDIPASPDRQKSARKAAKKK